VITDAAGEAAEGGQSCRERLTAREKTCIMDGAQAKLLSNDGLALWTAD
jgi:hypothetical protein